MLKLAAKIAALTEDLEKLRSEKNLLMVSLGYTREDTAATEEMCRPRERINGGRDLNRLTPP